MLKLQTFNEPDRVSALTPPPPGGGVDARELRSEVRPESEGSPSDASDLVFTVWFVYSLVCF